MIAFLCNAKVLRNEKRKRLVERVRRRQREAMKERVLQWCTFQIHWYSRVPTPEQAGGLARGKNRQSSQRAGQTDGDRGNLAPTITFSFDNIARPYQQYEPRYLR